MRRVFKPVIDRNADYHKWIEFIDAAEPDFEIYFTNLPEAATGTMSAEGVSKKLCRLSETHDEAMVYIRILEPSVIEYVTAFPDEIGKEVYLADPVRVVLGKE